MVLVKRIRRMVEDKAVDLNKIACTRENQHMASK